MSLDAHTRAHTHVRMHARTHARSRSRSCCGRQYTLAPSHSSRRMWRSVRAFGYPCINGPKLAASTLCSTASFSSCTARFSPRPPYRYDESSLCTARTLCPADGHIPRSPAFTCTFSLFVRAYSRAVSCANFPAYTCRLHARSSCRCTA
eukprot:2869664-Pleurochrysis_carterae.AAC.2